MYAVPILSAQFLRGEGGRGYIRWPLKKRKKLLTNFELEKSRKATKKLSVLRLQLKFLYKNHVCTEKDKKQKGQY